jgi:hypothetical protein
MFKINKIYAIYIINVDYILTIKRFIIVMIKLNDVIAEKKILAKIANLVNFFDQKKIGILFSFDKNIYAINLNDNKLFFKFLYNFLIKKLKILKIYLNIYLIKK